MDKRNLTKEQIESLHKFCEKHYVPYYDLQVELVDHLASVIENRWENEPNIGFEHALNDVYREFGVGGFSKVRMEKEKELRQKYSRLQRKYIGEFFKLPKIILTVVIAFILFALFRYSLDNLTTYLSILGFYIVCLTYYLLAVYPVKYRFELEFGKKLLLENHLRKLRRNTINYAMLPVSVFNVILFSSNMFDIRLSLTGSVFYDFLMALLMTLFGISLVAMLVYTPNRIKEEIVRLYPNIIIS